VPEADGAQLSARFHFALSYASALHQDQRRKSGGYKRRTPYVLHLLGTCAIVLENGGNETEAISALLHDAIEDQGGEAQAGRIRALFGAEVERIVRGCSDSVADTSKGEKKPPWEVRKRDYLAHLRSAEEDVAFVSAADKLDNARATARDVALHGERFWDVFNAPKERTIAYYQSLIAVFRTKGPRLERIVDELAQIIDALAPASA
jgi:(p)ppGpp synthase/HD superfamily hydrolase